MSLKCKCGYGICEASSEIINGAYIAAIVVCKQQLDAKFFNPKIVTYTGMSGILANGIANVNDSNSEHINEESFVAQGSAVYNLIIAKKGSGGLFAAGTVKIGNFSSAFSSAFSL